MAKDIDVNAAPPSAEQMRMALLEEQMAEADKQEKLRARANQEITKFTDSFLKDQVNEDEIAMVRRLVMNAVKNGKYEALVYSFPSDLCTDSGRAINSDDPQWTETLQGKAKQFYERYLKIREAAGLQAQSHDYQLPRRNAWRRRLLRQLGAGHQIGTGAGSEYSRSEYVRHKVARGYIVHASGRTLRSAQMSLSSSRSKSSREVHLPHSILARSDCHRRCRTHRRSGEQRRSDPISLGGFDRRNQAPVGMDLPHQLGVFLLHCRINFKALRIELLKLLSKSAKRNGERFFTSLHGFEHRSRAREFPTLSKIIGTSDNQEQSSNMFHGAMSLDH